MQEARPSLLLAAAARCNRALASVSGLAIGAMMAVGAVDIVLTNIDIFGLTSRPVPGANEIIATLMVVAVFLGVPLAQQRRGHIQVDLFTRRLPPALQRLAGALQVLLTGAVFAGIAWFGWKTTAHAWNVGEFAAGSFNLPLWPARFALALGATMMVLQCLLDLLGEALPSLRRAPQQAARAAD
jgi:TRAP-type C4-dicarboxylate transport system permease small subunit